MKKNILIIGPSRAGKTTLSRKFNEELKYSVINLDDIISTFEKTFPQLEIKHNENEIKVSNNFAPFLIQYLKELSDGPNFWNGNKYVIEGTHIDFDKVIPNIDIEKYIIIGLVYNNITSDNFYKNLKTHDTEDDWTYYCNDDELKSNVDYFIKRNNFFYENFIKYGIPIYDVSKNRDEIFETIISDVKKMI